MTTDLDATALAALVRDRKAKPSELVEEAIRRIEALNPKLNAVVTRMDDEAREAARAQDDRTPEGPFFGVPMLLKDIFGNCKGVRATSGSRFLEDFVPRRDTELVARYRRAGLVFVGKTNVPEFGFLPTTESQLFGAAHNPWSLGHTTGGSSGGSAAAVAARIVPLAHANDGGGSIRIPAACCGLFGMKPTRADHVGRKSATSSVGWSTSTRSHVRCATAPPCSTPPKAPCRGTRITRRARHARTRRRFARHPGDCESHSPSRHRRAFPSTQNAWPPCRAPRSFAKSWATTS
jgi:Asp-tRNA(Asn)/Glu-tRNA(Gln) amidotransferase A subunit family amidase